LSKQQGIINENHSDVFSSGCWGEGGITSIVILKGKRVLQEKFPCGITIKCNKKQWMIEELMVQPLREV